MSKLADVLPQSRAVDRGSSTPKATNIAAGPSANHTIADGETTKNIPSSAIDMETFQQIIDLDEEGSHEFSREMAWTYFSQVKTTLTQLEDAVSKKDLAVLSSLGHFLKGSSAALGVSKVQDSCEKIQHYGMLRDEDNGVDLSPEVALDKITKLLIDVKIQYAAAEKWLRKWYADHGGEKPED